MAIKDYEFWFIVGTQHLYGEEIFADINSHAQDMCDEYVFTVKNVDFRSKCT